MNLKHEISNCSSCKAMLPLDPRPVVSFHAQSKIMIIGQAPGLAVHKSGIPWDDKSGVNLRNWMGIDKDIFYDDTKIAIMPMGFCYPGKGKSGDLPPRKECAPIWHNLILNVTTEIELILLIGAYAQKYYLQKKAFKTLTETVRNFELYMPKYFVLPHPSPRNNIWMKKNEWFRRDVLPALKQNIKEIL